MRYPSIPKHLDFWLLPLFALLLLGFGIAEYPRALEKMRRVSDSWQVAKISFAMLLASGSAFWIGCHINWLKKTEALPPRYWFLIAVALAAIPGLMGWRVDYQPAWNTGITGINVYPGPISVLAFLAWIASLKIRAIEENLNGWKPNSSIAFLGLIWSWSVIHFAYSPYSAMLTLPVAALMLRGTGLFRGSLITFLIWSFVLLFYGLTRTYARDRLIAIVSPFQDPLGRNYVSYQVRKSLEDAGWSGTDSLQHLPNASHQFMLATVGEHWGWFGILITVFIVTTLFMMIRIRLQKIQDRWIRSYTLGLLGTLIIGSVINLIANLGLTGAAGMGIPFLSQNWFLAGITAFLVGVATQSNRAALALSDR